MKQEILRYLQEQKIPYKDFVATGKRRATIPSMQKLWPRKSQRERRKREFSSVDQGIGISMAANKVKGVRCALCHDCFSAEATRLHNDANILAMGGRVVGPGLAVKIADIFLHTPFSGEERHQRRINLMEGEDGNEN